MDYQWIKINIFTRWLYSTGQTGILVFNQKAELPSPLSNLDPEINQLKNPFWVYIHILEEVARLEESAVWAIRGHIRPLETSVKRPGRPQPDYRKLHDLARHAIHVTETLDAGLQTLEHILRQHGARIDPSCTNAWGRKHSPDIWQAIHSRLAFLQCYLSGLRHRSISNEKRLQNEIQLAFNEVAQYDADVTVQINKAMKSDSAALKTLAFVTFVFLPPTFICALFSMSFFDYSASSGWTVSSKFWIYWVSAVPTAVFTALVWVYWYTTHLHNHEVEIAVRNRRKYYV